MGIWGKIDREDIDQKSTDRRKTYGPCYGDLRNFLQGRVFAMVLGGLALCGSGKSLAQQEQLFLTADNLVPFAYLENDKAKGIFVTIVREILQRIEQNEIKIVAVPPRRGIFWTHQGRALAYFPMYDDVAKSDERIIRSHPFFKEDIVTLCRDESFEQHSLRSWPRDYRDLSVGFVIGGGLTSRATAFEGLTKKDYLEGGLSNRTNLLKMIHGRLDCVVTEHLSALLELKSMSIEGLYDSTKAPPFAVGSDVTTVSAFIGFHKLAGEAGGGEFGAGQSLVEQMDEALLAMQAEYRLEVILAEALR